MSASRPLRVLHVAASDQRRGAEVFAADLIRHTAHAAEHRMLFLRASSSATVDYRCPTRQLCGRRGWWSAPLAARDVRTELRRWRPDVVLAHGGEAYRTAVIGSIRKRVPVIYRRI